MPELQVKRNAGLPVRILRIACLLPLASGAAFEAAKAQVPTYSARYQIEYRGRIAGTSEITVSFDDQRGIYSFSSRSRARGLLRLVRPRDVLEHSDFIIEDDRIVPLEFRFEDGYRKDNYNFRMVFDWDAGRVAVAGSQDDVELELEPGVLDRGSMQVALMRDIAANGHPGPYTVMDDDDLSTYEFVRQEDAEVTTPAGTFTTQRFLQQRDGSSRTTLVWVVPQLRYLPAAIEQYRDGELRTRLLLESVEGL